MAETARFQWDQKRWQDAMLARAGSLSYFLSRAHNETTGREGLTAANKQLREAVEGLQFNDLSIGADFDRLNEWAEAKSRQCERMGVSNVVDIREGKTGKIIAKGSGLLVRSLLERYGIELPEKMSERGLLARAQDKTFWLRHGRKICYRGCEKILRELGFVQRFRGCYVSDFTLRRIIERDRKNHDLLESMEAVNELGECYTLAELNELSISNPEIRRGELMVRMRGFQEWAEKEGGWVNLFFTITCPSRFHSFNHEGQVNGRFSGQTPREGQGYLCSLWEKARAKLARENIDYFGFRVAEPHHDGTPHWHISIFVKADQQVRLVDTLQWYALRDSPEEPGAEKYRFKVVEVELGKAAGYIAKYVAKNIDGFGVGNDFENAEPAVKTAARVKAWASVWGIRQFQQVGGAGVTVWRKMRTLARNVATETMPEQLALIVNEADKADWCGYTDKMGGAVCPRKARPVSPEYAVREKAGKYGDEVRYIAGLTSIWKRFVSTVFHVWEIFRGLGLGFPRSRVNNCTQKNRACGARGGENLSFEFGFV